MEFDKAIRALSDAKMRTNPPTPKARLNGGTSENDKGSHNGYHI